MASNRPWRLVEPQLHVDMLRCLRELDTLFTAADIPYWICGGTLLGTLRHGGFIPHDDDVDLEVFAHDLERVRTLCEAHPHLLFTNRTRYYDKQFGKIFFHDRKELCIDLFWRESPCPLEPEFLGQEEIFPVRRYDFHDVQVNGPGNSEAYLKRCYGADCLTHCRIWTHDWNKQFTPGFSKNREILTIQEYQELCESLGYRQVRLDAHDSVEGDIEPGRQGGETVRPLHQHLEEKLSLRTPSPRREDVAIPGELEDGERRGEGSLVGTS